MLKKYVVCEEIIDNIYGCYSVRINTDCSLSRFKVLADFDTFEEADNYVDYLRHPEEHFEKDE